MVSAAPKSRLVSLVPNSGLQFLDFAFDIDKLPRANRAFWEERLTGSADPDGKLPVLLRCLQWDEAKGQWLNPNTGREPPADGIYDLNRAKGLEPFLSKWVPLPYFQANAPAEVAEPAQAFEQGPTNWARVRVLELPERDRHGNSHVGTLLFDTSLRPRVEGRPYVSPTPVDSQEQHEFRLAHEDRHNAWFLNEAWVDQWLETLYREFRQAQRPGRVLKPEDFPNACEHWARYLTFLQVLADTGALPRARLIDTVSDNRPYQPIEVDLVLDVGNSRTCGILMESNPDERLDLNNCYRLSLRDLSRPERVYDKPFESRVEFARASFGKDAISRRSGRGSAFEWPSPVRIGPEAVRLAGDALGNEGATGISSPKRYLWDERPHAQLWRFNGVAADGVTSEPPVSGRLMAYVAEDGDVLRQAKGTAKPQATRPKFSTSSMFTFLLSEILTQAMVAINAPAVRATRRHADVPRRLRRLILTMPPAMPLAEQRILRKRAEAAVKLTWDLFGWSESGIAAPPEPKVVLNLDEASCTQIVYLYTEITQKFQGDVDLFFELYGKQREGQPSLRVASIDIGGGTTDLIVATYTVEGRRAINPVQNFREGFKIAGDDILAAVLSSIVLPAIASRAAASGVGDPKALLADLFGGDRGGQSVVEQHLRTQVVNQVLVPAGLAILHAAEQAPIGATGPLLARALLAPDDAGIVPTERVVRFFEERAQAHGARGFKLAEVEIAASGEQVENAVRGVLGQILADLSEVIHLYDCDVLLLSGRPSRLPAVQAAVLGKLPVPADRIVAMHQYPVGMWYPFRNHQGRIDDPKSTAAVGAMLCAVAEGHLESFLMRASRLTMKSTARHIGEMELSGQIPKANVLLSDVDLDQKAKGRGAESFQVKFYAPLSLGFRQLAVERWPATPLYRMEFANPQTAAQMALPLTVTVERVEGEEGDEAARERFEVVDIVEANGNAKRKSDVVLRLQTLRSDAGYWLDTGVLVTH